MEPLGKIPPLLETVLRDRGLDPPAGVDKRAFLTIFYTLRRTTPDATSHAEEVHAELSQALAARLDSEAEPIDSLISYIVIAAKRRALNRVRSLRAIPEVELTDAIEGRHRVAPNQLSVDDADLVKSASRSVSSRDWQLFVALEFEGLSTREVARIFGLTVGSVRVIKCRTVKRLRDAIEEELDPARRS